MTALTGVTILLDGSRALFESTTDTLLADLYRTISTDIVQSVEADDSSWSIWVDEEGWLKYGALLNYAAGDFADENGVTGHLFAGIAVVLGGTDDDGETLSLTPEQLAAWLP